MEELIPNVLTVGDVHKVLRNLLVERVPIKDILTILECLGDHAPTVKDHELLTEYVRNALNRTIIKPYLNYNQAVEVITIHPSIETKISNNIQRSFQGSFPAIDPQMNQRILDSLNRLYEQSMMQNQNPVVLASPKVRVAFRKLIEIPFPQVAVLALTDIPNDVNIEVLGMVSLDDH